MAGVAAIQKPDPLVNITQLYQYSGVHHKITTQQSPAVPMEEPMEVEEYPQTTPGQVASGVNPNVGHSNIEEEAENCSICLDNFVNKTVLPKCSHEFCKECIDMQFKYKPACPICGTVYGKICGNQPPGTLNIQRVRNAHLPGYENYGIISVTYNFPDGIQTAEHPHPGVKFYGTSRTGYFPDSPEGVKVVRLLTVAFDRRLVFTVGRSRTTGADNVVTWNDIHHKTTYGGGPQNFGYPDPTYFARVQEELAAKGVTEADLDHTTMNIIPP